MSFKKKPDKNGLADVLRLIFDELSVMENQVKATRAAFVDAMRDAGMEPECIIPALQKTRRNRRPAAARSSSALGKDSSLT